MRALWPLLLCSGAVLSAPRGACAVEYETVASVNHVVLQHPAPGSFSLAEIKWVFAPVPHVGKMLTAVIPADRVPDLHVGEGVRAGTNEPPKETSGLKRGRADRHTCQRAEPVPRKRKRSEGGEVDEPAKKKRRGPGLLHGEDETALKVGCPVSYTIKIEGDRAVVRCAALEHTHPTDTPARYHPDWIKPWIANEYRSADGKVDATQLVAQIQKMGQDADLLGQGFGDWSEALDTYEDGDAQPTDWRRASRCTG